MRTLVVLGLVALLAAFLGRPAGADEKPKVTEKVLSGEVAIDVDCEPGSHKTGEIKFLNELPKVPRLFLMENNQTGAFVIFKADEVTTKGFTWAGFKIFGVANYRTNLVWLAVLPE